MYNEYWLSVALIVLQVYELHRLYHIQKLLMNSSVGKSTAKGNKTESWDLQNEISFSHQLNYELQRKLELEQPAEELEIIDESEIQLTLGPTRYNNRRKKSEAQLTSDSGLSFSSSSTGSSHVNRTSSRPHCLIRSKEQLRQDERLKLPPWLFQVLSLNMTWSKVWWSSRLIWCDLDFFLLANL